MPPKNTYEPWDLRILDVEGGEALAQQWLNSKLDGDRSEAFRHWHLASLNKPDSMINSLFADAPQTPAMGRETDFIPPDDVVVEVTTWPKKRERGRPRGGPRRTEQFTWPGVVYAAVLRDFERIKQLWLDHNPQRKNIRQRKAIEFAVRRYETDERRVKALVHKIQDELDG